MDFRSDFLTTLSLELAILNIFTLKKVVNHYNSLLPQQSQIVYNEDNYYERSYAIALAYTTDLTKKALKANSLIMNDYEYMEFLKSWNLMPYGNYQTKEELEKGAINNVVTLK